MTLNRVHQLKNNLPSRWWKSIPFVIGLAVIAFIIWTTLKSVEYPHDGTRNISQTGIINQVDPSGPASQKLQNGDRIISVDNVPWQAVFAPYKDKQSGDQVDLLIDRGGEFIHTSVTLVNPPFSEIIVRLVPIIIALVFWALGMWVQTYKPPDGDANIFFAWCQGCALTLTAGSASYLEPVWTSILFSSSLRFIGPLSVHFHMDFPQPAKLKYKRQWIILLYTLSCLGILAYLITRFYGDHLPIWNALSFLLGRLYLGFNLLLVVVLLFYHYTHAATAGVRAKIRLVAFGGGLSGLSIVVFTLLPDGLVHQPILPYQYTFLLLAIIPLTYGYAIYRYHLIEIDEHVSRWAANFLVYSIIGATYLAFYTLIARGLPRVNIPFPLLNTIIVLLLVTLFSPLRLWVQRFVDKIFYGNWYDYRQGVMSVTQGLDDIAELHSLAKTISERLVNILNLEESCAFLRGPDGNFSVVEVVLRPGSNVQSPRTYPVLPRSSLSYLLKIGTVERNNLRKALSDIPITPEELQLLNSEQIHLWVPIVGHEQILGLLALGPKLGGDVYSTDDLDILRVLVRQMGPIIEKMNLLTRLRQHAAELEKRVKERTAELHNSKERVEAILASVGDGVIVTDLDGKIIRANPAIEKQSGYTSSEIIGKGLDTLQIGVGYPDLFSYIKSSLQRKGGIWSGDLTNLRKSGEPYYVQFIMAPVCDQDDLVVGYVGSQIDITRQKELERMKDTFVADVSHELRTPTTSISLYLDILERAPADKQTQYIAILKEQTRQLVRLVEDILDLSRLTRAKAGKSLFSDTNLNLLVEEVIQAHIVLALSSSVQLKFEPYPDLPHFLSDQNQISRMISNLVTNAIRYTREGEVSVRTCLDDGMLCLMVHDTGIGIAPEDIPHIFERFYRGGNVRQPNMQGTGLGLAIVKEIVEQHEGRIEVQSELGRGSTFTVWLPSRSEENL
jgi:PAS domain S-box-containing protein